MRRVELQSAVRGHYKLKRRRRHIFCDNDMLFSFNQSRNIWNLCRGQRVSLSRHLFYSPRLLLLSRGLITSNNAWDFTDEGPLMIAGPQVVSPCPNTRHRQTVDQTPLNRLHRQTHTCTHTSSNCRCTQKQLETKINCPRAVLSSCAEEGHGK